MKDKIQHIIERLVTNDQQWFVEQDIDISNKAHHWMLNYNQIGKKNDYNKLTRGLVIDKRHQKVVSFPFCRFFNVGESHAAPIQIENADLLEKLDGSLVCIFFDEANKPIWHTRKMISANPADLQLSQKKFHCDEEVQILSAVGRYIYNMRWSGLELGFTFMFEAVCEATRVVTRYSPEQYGLYLIGIRNLVTYEELSEDGLDEVANSRGWRRGRRWKADSLDAIITMAEDHAPDFEGYVLRDQTTGDRVKIKKKSYLERHRLIGRISYKRLVPIYVKGERNEIEAYFPEVKEMFDKIHAHYCTFLENTIRIIREWQEKNLSRKDLALAITATLPKNVCSFIFKFINERDNLGQKVKEKLDSLGEEKILEVIGLE